MLIKYNPKYPIKHLSIRVPWHDNKWNGTVCKEPKANDSCLTLKNCALNRKDDIEAKLACKHIADIQNKDDYPPCVRDRGTFMSEKDIEISISHPYNHYRYKHIIDTPLKISRYSSPAVPFAWLRPDGIRDKVKKFNLDYNESIEPYAMFPRDNLYWTKEWLQNSINQKIFLDCFFEHIKPSKSLCFFYVKKVPFIEESNRILIGIGDISNVDQLGNYLTSEDKEFNSMLWEHNVYHTIRPDNENGFILPYHEGLEYQKDHPEFDPKQLAVIIPNDMRHEFSYASEHVSNDFVLYVLRESFKRMEVAKKYKIGKDHDSILKWITKKISQVEEMRGDYPGLGAALNAFKIEKAYFLAQEIFNCIDISDCPWEHLNKVLKDPENFLPKELAQYIKEPQIKSWKRIQNTTKLKLLQLISRFNLSDSQAINIFSEIEREKKYHCVTDQEIIDNPYLIYEISIESIDPISFSTIDTGLMLNRCKPLLPENKIIYDPYSLTRIRALTVKELYRQASGGHTLYPEDEIIYNISNMSIEPKCELDPTYFAAAAADDVFQGKIVVHTTANEKTAYQLHKYNEIDELISKVVKMRYDADTFDLDKDWESFLSFIPFKDTKDDLNSKIEKVEALKEMANSRLSVVVGPAGSGKTTLLTAFASVPEIRDGGVLFLAPTGKSKVRMLEEAKERGLNVIGKTIAQFLYPSKRFKGDTQSYQLNNSKYKERACKNIIIDECSMLTEEMLGATLQNIVGAQRIILVGDYRQLPPIGAGKPFFDVINFIKKKNGLYENENLFPKVKKSYIELTKTFRQTSDDDSQRIDLEFANLFSDINSSADTGSLISEISAGKSDYIRFESWEQDSEFEEKLFNILNDELGINDKVTFNKKIGSDDKGDYFTLEKSVEKIEQWQILSPVRSNVFGTTQINREIHQKYKKDVLEKSRDRFNHDYPKPLGLEEIVYGDKVINLRNNSEMKGKPATGCTNYIANGEVGIAIGERWKYVRKGRPKFIDIEFATQKGVKYSFKSDGKSSDESECPLELAYALTIHKAQGSQFDTVILVIPNPCFLLSRELLYTAFTRQQSKIIVLYQGQPYDICNYTSDQHSDTLKRLTNLFYKPNITKINGNLYDANSIHTTSDGKFVKSKSELIIYELLIARGIEVLYEEPLVIDNVKKLPDFYICDDAGREYYWEHLGMLNDENYRINWNNKQKWYESNNIIPLEQGGGKNGTLIITRDDKKGGFSAEYVKKMIEDTFNTSIEKNVIDQIKKMTEKVLIGRDEVICEISFLLDLLCDLKNNEDFDDIEDKINKIYSILDKNIHSDSLDELYDTIEENFPDYYKLEENSRSFLASSLFLHNKFVKADVDDYSPIVLQYCRVIENEFLNKIFIPFYDNIDDIFDDKDDVIIDAMSNDKTKTFSKMLMKNNRKITMGTMEWILNLIKDNKGNTLNEVDLLKGFREHALKVVDENFVSKNMMKSLKDLIENYRNSAAHVERIHEADYKIFCEKITDYINKMIDNFKC